MTALLQVDEASKIFAGISALDQVSVRVDVGERVALIGPNGAGKTTLFNCIVGQLRPDAGVVLIEGRDVGGAPPHVRARMGLGRTFQRMEMFADSTVEEHLLIAERIRNGRGGLLRDLMGLGRAQPAEVERCDEVLELLGLSDVAHEPIEHLSLGRARLVEVGRALITDPKVLLLDEPSSGLDSVETSVLADTLRAVQDERGFAILLVEHDVDLVMGFCERAYVLDFGRLIAEGDTTEVMSAPAVRAAYLGTAKETS